ncbi:hypothetical protein [Brachyspira hyodysenteriae]|uniref:hypothetical protein n=1 Tax=Brachyspira hyodysenteriae TaxID=159 RepID=UPI00063D9255|nr:hypothetical protein [Brachyspira hyodysenteriae]KLI46102.1 hypothetical protein SZ41_12070 [Brachyspira hyodysenteriae]KLI53657.1 hypothetical protein SZ42_00795 [Brachyspira hyodysenteriae]HJH54784.1 hypothetical protein [Brachyspira hyodysenteriae]
MQVKSKASYEQPKTGYVKAKCLSVVDGRYDKAVYNGIEKWTRRVFLIFEINQKVTRGEEKYIGRNMIFPKEFTLSASPESILRKMLEGCRGKIFGEKVDSQGNIILMTKKKNEETGQIEEVPFEMESLQGLDCILLFENVGKDKSYITITKILQLPKTETPIQNENCLGYLPDNLARKIALRPEVNPDDLSQPIRGYPDGYLGEEDDDEVPF